MESPDSDYILAQLLRTNCSPNYIDGRYSLSRLRPGLVRSVSGVCPVLFPDTQLSTPIRLIGFPQQFFVVFVKKFYRLISDRPRYLKIPLYMLSKINWAHSACAQHCCTDRIAHRVKANYCTDPLGRSEYVPVQL